MHQAHYIFTLKSFFTADYVVVDIELQGANFVSEGGKIMHKTDSSRLQ